MPFKRSIGNHTNSIQGSTRSVGKDGWRSGEDPMKFSNIPYHIYIYTKNVLERSQKPTAIHSYC